MLMILLLGPMMWSFLETIPHVMQLALLPHGIVLPLRCPREACFDFARLFLREGAVFFAYRNDMFVEEFLIRFNILISFLSLPKVDTTSKLSSVGSSDLAFLTNVLSIVLSLPNMLETSIVG